MLRWLIALLVVSAAPAMSQDAPSRGTIIIGFRQEARPFVWQDRDSGAYRGYLADLCYEAVLNANYLPQGVTITATQRAAFLQGKPEASGDATPEIDLLCDPTTISMRRLSGFLRLKEPPDRRFSPIVFLANGTFSQRPRITKESLDRSGADLTDWTCMGEGDASSATLLVGFVVGTTAEDEINELMRSPAKVLGSGDEPRWQRICSYEFKNHAEGVGRLCAGEIDLYFGDSDIVNAYAALSPSCNPVTRPKRTSYEPYAFVVTDRTPGFYDHFVKGLYASFGNDTKAQNRVRTYFPDQEISTYLEILYRIYRLP